MYDLGYLGFLNAQTRFDKATGKGVPCGNGYISKGETCRVGKGGVRSPGKRRRMGRKTKIATGAAIGIGGLAAGALSTKATAAGAAGAVAARAASLRNKSAKKELREEPLPQELKKEPLPQKKRGLSDGAKAAIGAGLIGASVIGAAASSRGGSNRRSQTSSTGSRGSTGSSTGTGSRSSTGSSTGTRKSTNPQVEQRVAQARQKAEADAEFMRKNGVSEEEIASTIKGHEDRARKYWERKLNTDSIYPFYIFASSRLTRKA